MFTGRVIRYKDKTGYGFISPQDGGKDVFLHVNQLASGEDSSKLREGVMVSYTVSDDGKGPRAHEVRVLSRPVRQPHQHHQADILTEEEFRGEVCSILSQNFITPLTELARRHGWVA
jgi:cold shock protein